MTIKSLGPACAKLRASLAGLLSDYGAEIGFEAAPLSPSKNKGPARSKGAAPPADVVWFDGGERVCAFYVLPHEKISRRLCGRPDLGPMILCLDRAGKPGFLEPGRFVRLLETESARVDRQALSVLLEGLPEAPSPTPQAQFCATVIENTEIVPDHFSLIVEADDVQVPLPGQFLQVMCDPVPHAAAPGYRGIRYSERTLPRLQGSELIERRPFLRRPFSIASYRGIAGGTDGSRGARNFFHLVRWLSAEIEIIYKRMPGGPGTGALAARRAGDKIDMIGPLGKGFTFSPVPEISLLIGGGIGAPPLVFLAEELNRKGSAVKIFLGAQSKSKIPFRLDGPKQEEIRRFERIGLRPVICTDDGSAGLQGLVTGPVVQYLEHHESELPQMKMFACGPRPLLSALNGIADRFRLPCEALLEERMACGIGACISCVCAVKEPGQKAHFTRICIEGPAFDVQKVMWHA